MESSSLLVCSEPTFISVKLINMLKTDFSYRAMWMMGISVTHMFWSCVTNCKRGPRLISIIWLTKWQIRFTIILWSFTWGVFVTSSLPNDKYASQLSLVTNTPQVKHHRIIVKRICHFVDQMILYLGPLLQCRLFLCWLQNNFSKSNKSYLSG
jgi:hypothetical protein